LASELFRSAAVRLQAAVALARVPVRLSAAVAIQAQAVLEWAALAADPIRQE
jgi:hypothetical protein